LEKKTLSYDGKVVLINSVLSSLAMNVISFFEVPRYYVRLLIDQDFISKGIATRK
jgi:hypothetical protein